MIFWIVFGHISRDQLRLAQMPDYYSTVVTLDPEDAGDSTQDSTYSTYSTLRASDLRVQYSMCNIYCMDLRIARDLFS